MKSRHLFLPLFIFLSAATHSHADTVTIDFDDNPSCKPEWVKEGIRLTNSRGTICVSTNHDNGTNCSNDLYGLKVVHTEGAVFTPKQVDLAEYSSSLADPIQFVGKKANGETVIFDVTLDKVWDGSGGADDFQTFTFPASFTDIVSMETPSRYWRMDNLIIDTISPPPLPNNLKLGSFYESYEFIRSQQYNYTRYLVIGPDYHYKTGTTGSTGVVFLNEQSNILSSFKAGSPYYDPTTNTAVYKPLNYQGYSIPQIDQRNPNISQTLITLEEVQTAGYSVTSIGVPILYGDRLVFQGFNTSGGDSYSIFELLNGSLTLLLGPDTLLPDGNGDSDKPYYWPDHSAIGNDALAFDTSLENSRTVWRVFVKWGSNDFQSVCTEGDPTKHGVITEISNLAFDSSNRLLVDISYGTGKSTLVYDANGLVEEIERTVTTNPVNSAISVRGYKHITDSDHTYLFQDGVQYREFNGQYYKILGVGDFFDGDTIYQLNFLGATDTPPIRVFMDVAYKSDPYLRKHYAITLSDPIDFPPRFGKPVYHKNGKLYLPISYLTLGRSYELQTSQDMTTWNAVSPVQEILPLQHLIIDQPLAPKAFYRVIEQPTDQEAP